MGKNEFYKMLTDPNGNRIALFKPREWRGNGTSTEPLGLDKPNVLSAGAMAAEINSYPRGTVTQLYTTSDGGFNLEQLNEMVSMLGEHVEIVNTNEIALRAMQRG